MKVIPVLYFQDAAGDVLIFMPNREDVLDCLRHPALGHRFEVAHWRDVLIVSQGDAWHKAPRSFKKPVTEDECHRYDVRLVQRYKAVMIGGGPTRETCSFCPRSRKDCDGPEHTSPDIEITNLKPKTAVDAMREAVRQPGNCPLYEFDAEAKNGTIRRQHLRHLGFSPSSNVRAFTTNDMGSYEHETLFELQAKGVDLGDWDTVASAVNDHVFLDKLLRSGCGNREHGRLISSTITKLDFDPLIVEANHLASKIRGGYSKKRKREYESFRQCECARCVYSCQKPPWDTERPCVLTMEDVLEQNVPRDDDLVWMALHTITGESLKIGRRTGIGSRPKHSGGEWGIEVRSQRPPYDVIDVLSVHEYWSRVHDFCSDDEVKNRYRDRMPELNSDLDKKRLTITNWALRQLHEITRYGEAHFVVNDRRMRNDILFIRLRNNCDYIEIGSDTRASYHGGMRERGSSISVDERPRFKTGYSYPFFDDIWEWFESAPGARGGRRK